MRLLLLLTVPVLALAGCVADDDPVGPEGPDTTLVRETTAVVSDTIPPRTSGPPLPYVSRGACPFECCTY
ncbi:MAG TPA: hypothetical protein VK610_08210, partial [Rhodothermales bacterium]|nr:hypothetical protein [Rhodothermales bacterium]